MIAEIKEYMKNEGSLASLSLAEGSRVAGYIKALINELESRVDCPEDELPCGCKCSCHDKSPFHMSDAKHKESVCACTSGCGCQS